jgi:chromosomal replication initiation ATPase DnaA
MSQTVEAYRAGYNPEFLARLAARRLEARNAELAAEAEQELANREPNRQRLLEQKAEETRQRRIEARRIVEEITALREQLARAEAIEKACKRARTSYHKIEARALRVFNVMQEEIRSELRPQRIVIARQFISYWARRLTDLSLPQIGRLMGDYDHTTVLHGQRVYPVKRKAMGRYLRSLGTISRPHQDRKP